MGVVTIGLIGDVLPTRRLVAPPAEVASVYALLGEVDVSIGNLEMPFTTAPTPVEKLLNIRCVPEIAADLPVLNVDVFNLANNHAVDYGWDGLKETVAHVEKAGIRVIGAGRNRAEAAAPAILSAAGCRVGVIAFSSLTPTGMAASDTRPGISAIRIDTSYEVDPWYQMEEPGDPSVLRIRTRARPEDVAFAAEAVRALSARCDVLVATIHWGFGSGDDLAEYQVPLAQALIDAGADIVHGHHPHAIHPIGFYKGKPILFTPSTFIGQQVFLDASPKVHRLWAGMSPDGYVAHLQMAGRKLQDMVCYPTVLGADRLPRLARGADFARIAERLARLSRPMCATVDVVGDTLKVSPLDPGHEQEAKAESVRIQSLETEGA
jgi:hypothetical protein